MSGQSNKKTIEENVLDLLFGLVNAEEAENLRRLVATDSEVARVYDEVRKIFADAAQAVRVESPFVAKENGKFGNVTVDAVNKEFGTKFNSVKDIRKIVLKNHPEMSQSTDEEIIEKYKEDASALKASTNPSWWNK